ncbi:hypothetical protein Barb6_00076 [Bacteroidales bacterium Barb6]|nr:hypothetical protein Barb6_00076 [Bacteroidales bacterium Barb6]
MLKGVTGKCGMVYFDVQGEVLVQTVMAEEADNGFRIDIVLMLGRFHRFRLNEEGSLEALFATVIACEGKQGGKMVFFALHVGIQKRHIAFATSPEHVVLTAKGNTGVDGVLYLRGGTGDNGEVGVCGGTVHVTLVAEYVGG